MSITKSSSFKHANKVVLIALVILFSTHTYANDIEVGGLLTNRTITWFGQDFFNQFASDWRNDGVKGVKNIVIEEVPSARKGTQIVIRYNRDIIFQTSISGTRNQSRERGMQAVSYVVAKVQRLKYFSMTSQFAELATDEF